VRQAGHSENPKQEKIMHSFPPNDFSGSATASRYAETLVIGDIVPYRQEWKSRRPQRQ
jgi:hypothetical protein